MYIEDLIISLVLSRNQTINPYDSKLLQSFYDQIIRGSGFTEKQEILSVKILKRQVSKLNAIIGYDISEFLDAPKCRLPRRTVSSYKRMSIIPHTFYGKAIKVEFPFNNDLLAKIREGKSKINYSIWDAEAKSWIFSLDERSLNFLIPISREEDFSVDEEFKNYQEQVDEIKKSFEDHIPMLSYDGKNMKFSNVSPKIPQPTNLNILENLFDARKLGIFTWDDTIEETAEWKNADEVVRKFLQSDPMEDFNLNLENSSIFTIQDIVKYLFPALFVIPGGSELEKLEISLEFLKSIGIENEEISVLFRLPNETGEKFNNFVRERKLNSPLSEKTKIVFISSKVPKTIIENKIKFNCVVNFNFYSIHYSIKNLIKWHPNVIHITEKTQQRTFNFAIM